MQLLNNSYFSSIFSLDVWYNQVPKKIPKLGSLLFLVVTIQTNVEMEVNEQGK